MTLRFRLPRGDDLLWMLLVGAFGGAVLAWGVYRTYVDMIVFGVVCLLCAALFSLQPRWARYAKVGLLYVLFGWSLYLQIRVGFTPWGRVALPLVLIGALWDTYHTLRADRSPAREPAAEPEADDGAGRDGTEAEP